jgi:hypothetical protein
MSRLFTYLLETEIYVFTRNVGKSQPVQNSGPDTYDAEMVRVSPLAHLASKQHGPVSCGDAGTDVSPQPVPAGRPARRRLREVEAVRLHRVPPGRDDLGGRVPGPRVDDGLRRGCTRIEQHLLAQACHQPFQRCQANETERDPCWLPKLLTHLPALGHLLEVVLDGLQQPPLDREGRVHTAAPLGTGLVRADVEDLVREERGHLAHQRVKGLVSDTFGIVVPAPSHNSADRYLKNVV